MINFWQTYNPQPIAFTVASWSVHWYGLILILAILIAYFYIRPYYLKHSVLSRDQVDDMFFYLIIGGIVGARLGHVLYTWSYYQEHWLDIAKIWHGGLSIQGAIILALLTLWWWSKRNKVYFWQILGPMMPALALGQAIGRWGNYFNQELYGHPTSSWWGIYIDPINRLDGYEQDSLFIPAFFVESILNLILFIILNYLFRRRHLNAKIVALLYFLGYSSIRFCLEYIRIDNTLMVGSWRLPQAISLGVMVISAATIIYVALRPLPKGLK